MVRADKNGVKRCRTTFRHIAGLDYAVFTPEEEIVDPKVVFFSPKEGDPEDYVAIELKEWKTYHHYEYMCTNVGLIKPEYFAYGNAMQRRKANAATGRLHGKNCRRSCNSDPDKGLRKD